MILTNFNPGESSDILKTGVCLKECPKTKGKKFKNGDDCKDNNKLKCISRDSYETNDVFDFCLPTGLKALE